MARALSKNIFEKCKSSSFSRLFKKVLGQLRNVETIVWLLPYEIGCLDPVNFRISRYLFLAVD